MFKRDSHQPLGEEIPKLVRGADLDQLDAPVAVGSDVRPEPVVATRIVLGARGHATRLELAQRESANIVFVHMHTNVGDILDGNAKAAAELVDQVDGR